MTQRMVVSAQQINIEIECFYKFIAEMGVKTYGYFVSYLVDYDKGSIKQPDDILVFFLIVVFFYFLPHDVIE